MATYDYSGGGKGISAVGGGRVAVLKYSIDLAAESARRVLAGLAALASGDVLTIANLPSGCLISSLGIVVKRASTSATSTLTMGSAGGAALTIAGALNGKTAGLQVGTVTDGRVHPTDLSATITLTITAETAIATAGSIDVYINLIDLT
jgi:hypothetical protein